MAIALNDGLTFRECIRPHRRIIITADVVNFKAITQRVTQCVYI